MKERCFQTKEWCFQAKSVMISMKNEESQRGQSFLWRKDEGWKGQRRNCAREEKGQYIQQTRAEHFTCCSRGIELTSVCNRRRADGASARTAHARQTGFLSYCLTWSMPPRSELAPGLIEDWPSWCIRVRPLEMASLFSCVSEAEGIYRLFLTFLFSWFHLFLAQSYSLLRLALVKRTARLQEMVFEVQKRQHYLDLGLLSRKQAQINLGNVYELVFPILWMPQFSWL